MALRLGQTLKLQQNLVMTPQLQLAIKLLQMTRLELQETIQTELLENPTLELTESEAEVVKSLEDLHKDPEFQGSMEDQFPEASQSRTLDSNEQLNQDFKQDLHESLDARTGEHQDGMDWDAYFDSYDDRPSPSAPRDPNAEDDAINLEGVLTQEHSMYDFLHWQVKLSNYDDVEQAIAEEIIGNIDEEGYLRIPDDKGRMLPLSLVELAERLNVPLDRVELVHKRIMRLDPIGIGARDLRECLLMQAKFSANRNALVAKILEHHWELVEKRDVVKLTKVLKVTKEEIAEAFQVMTSYDPKPGLVHSNERTEYVTPDIYITKIGDDYHITLNDDGMPKLRISNYYKQALRDKKGPSEAREYIKDKLRGASWLIKSIQQRQRTIYKVAESIVKQQRDFLDHGVDQLKPMVLRDIAEDIGMHECTVSRVTTNKYIHTPQGIFELKYFFNSGITNSEGTDIASETIKNKIRQLVSQENPKHPYSDQKLVQMLKQDGVDVARRTVAKYRDMLGVLSSSKRKKTF